MGDEMILVGLLGRRSLSPCMSPSQAPVLSCADYFQVPATQANFVQIYFLNLTEYYDMCIFFLDL